MGSVAKSAQDVLCFLLEHELAEVDDAIGMAHWELTGFCGAPASRGTT